MSAVIEASVKNTPKSSSLSVVVELMYCSRIIASYIKNIIK